VVVTNNSQVVDSFAREGQISWRKLSFRLVTEYNVRDVLPLCRVNIYVEVLGKLS
jgi:hypothetical protein